MTNCCNTSQAVQPKKHVCPVNGKPCSEVSVGTVMHHINQPWNYPLSDQAYFFCDDPDCEVVYFSQDNTTIKTDSLRTKVGIKEQTEKALICYCFGINRQQSKSSPWAKAFVIEQTKNHRCSCNTSNPSGRCCLKDFPG
jgi:hypothetical protein